MPSRQIWKPPSTIKILVVSHICVMVYMPAAIKIGHVTSSERVTCVFVKQIWVVATTCTHCNFWTRNCNFLTVDTYSLYAYRSLGKGHRAFAQQRLQKDDTIYDQSYSKLCQLKLSSQTHKPLSFRSESDPESYFTGVRQSTDLKKVAFLFPPPSLQMLLSQCPSPSTPLAHFLLLSLPLGRRRTDLKGIVAIAGYRSERVMSHVDALWQLSHTHINKSCQTETPNRRNIWMHSDSHVTNIWLSHVKLTSFTVTVGTIK